MSRYLSFGAILAAVAVILSVLGGCWREPPAPPKPASAALPVVPPVIPAPVVINKVEPPAPEPVVPAKAADVSAKIAGVESIPPTPPQPDCTRARAPRLVTGCVSSSKPVRKSARRARQVVVDDGKTWVTFRRANVGALR